MLEIPQRVEVIEKRMEDYTTLFADIRTGLQRFEARVDARFGSVDSRFTSIDERFTQMDARFTALDQKVDRGFARVDEQFDGFRREMLTHSRWSIGIMITCLAAIVAGMGAIFAAVVSR